MKLRHALTLLLLWLAATPATGATPGGTPARRLIEDARRRIALNTYEQRQYARGCLEQASTLEPDNIEAGLMLGRIYLESDMLGRARTLAQSMLALDSTRAESQFLLGEIWRRTWLVDADEAARDHGIVRLARGLRFAPGDFVHYQMLVPMLVDAGEREQARSVAMLAARAQPANPDAWLLLAYAAQNAGDVTTADGMFRKALSAVPASLRSRYEDLTPLVSTWRAVALEEMAPEERTRHALEFWRGSDPDLVTPENEARLEFYARVTHAWLLYGVTSLGAWDMRAELYIRYGRPAWIERNPMLNAGLAQYGNWLVWTYPELGLRVWMEARNPLAHYEAPFSAWAPVRVAPFPDSLAHHPELLAVSGGHALFRSIPANTLPMPIECMLAQFEASDVRHVLSQAEVFASPDRVLTAEWVVLDSADVALVRSTHAFGVSACGPGDARSASFTAELLPGTYRLGVRAEDGEGHTAVARQTFVVPATGRTLGISDLVVTCGSPQLDVFPGSGVRLQPETGLLPMEGEQLNAYFEIYRLTPSPDGRADFEYQCRVRRAEDDRRSWLSRVLAPRLAPPPVEMSRRESALGDMRRQFLSIPIRELPPGRYELEVRVRDLTSGQEGVSLADFTRK